MNPDPTDLPRRSTSDRTALPLFRTPDGRTWALVEDGADGRLFVPEMVAPDSVPRTFWVREAELTAMCGAPVSTQQAPTPARSTARALNAAAGVICAAWKAGRQTPMGVACALDSAGLVQSPEAAAEMARLREERQSTNAALAEVTLALRSAEADRDAWRGQRNDVFDTNVRLLARVDELGEARLRAENETRTVMRELTRLRARLGDGATRTVDEDPIAYALTEKAEEIAVAIERRGEAFLPGHPVWPYVPVFAGIARGQEVPPRSRPCGREQSTGEPCPDHPRPAESEPRRAASVGRLRDLLARQRADAEDPHDGPLHHKYAVGRDLPETGVSS